MSQVTELLIRIRQQGDQQLTKLQGSLKSLAQQTAATNVNFKEVSEELRKIQATSTQSINNLRGYASTWREIANSVKVGTAEFKQASAEAAKLEAQLEKVQPGGRGRLAKGAQIAGTIAGAGVFGGLEGTIGAGVGALVGGVPGAITGGAIGAQVGQFRQALGGTATYAADIAKQRQALQLVTKDSSEYRRALEFIGKTSRDLAIPQDILTRQFTKLTASVKGAGGSVQDAETAFIGIASGIRGTGGSLEQLDSALTATSQVFSKGKVSAEELRQQIGERLPGAFSLFAESLKMTPQQLDKALENGTVSLQDFQLFAEKLFQQYGENAKIIADGPDAAGDRLKTSLGNLSESIGSLLKPIGASFQNTFAGIIAVIDQTIRKLNQFLGLGKGRQGEINNLQRILDVTDKRIKAFENLRTERGGKLGPIEQPQYERLLQRKASTFSQLQALLAAEMAAAGTAEPPKGLPGIDTTQKTKTTKIPVQRLADLTAKSEQALLLSSKQLRIEELITQAKSKGYKYDEQILPLLSNIIQSNTKINLAQEHRDDLLKNENQLRRQGMSHEEFSARLNAANDAIETQRNLRKAAFLQFQRQEADIAKQIYEEEVDARHEINVLIADTQLKTKILGDEDLRRVEINRVLAQTIEKFAGILTSTELLEAIRALREAMQGAANASKDFGTNIAKGIADSIKSMGNLAANLSGAIGNAFIGLSDQFAEFINTGKASFADFTQSILTDLSKILIRFAMFQTLKALVPSGSAFGKFLGFANGGIMTGNGPLELRRYAAGGIASSPQLAMFGEGSRPEAYVPLPDGRSIPVTMRGNGQGANITVNVDARGSSVEGDQAGGGQLARAVAAAVQQELIKQQRPGGVLRR